MKDESFFLKYLQLSRRLTQLSETSDSFFNDALLKILNETLGYRNITISKYVAGKYCGIINIGFDLLDSDFHSKYYEEFRHKDPFAKALT